MVYSPVTHLSVLLEIAPFVWPTHSYRYSFLQDPCTEADTEEQCLLGLLKRVHAKKKFEKEKEKKTEKDVTMVEEVSDHLCIPQLH